MNTIKTMKTAEAPEAPDWDALEHDVVLRIRLLRAAWKGTESDPGALHSQMARDLYLPAIRGLAAFCMMIEVEQE